MAFPKLRNLSKYGIVSDASPFDLPPEAFSAGVNVRFTDGHVERAPVFRTASTLSDASPRFVIANDTGSGFDDIYIGYKSGKVKKYAIAGETDYSISGYSDSDAETPYTGTVLSRVLYVNREDRVPWSLVPSGTAMEASANWDSGWRTKVLRSYNSCLVALNVTKSGTASPTMVKTSDIALDATVPGSWDDTDPTNNATENVLSEMKGVILDGQSLHESFIIYSNKQTWVMQADGSENVYSYRPLFKDIGVINANCAVEVDGNHYVFGANDLWMHDGVTKVSIADGRCRKFVFKGINAKKASSCFVNYDPNLKTISFNFVSGDNLTAFSADAGGCNRAAVYSLIEKNWTYYDLPLLFAADVTNVDNSPTWTSATATWSTAGGSWQDLEDGFKKGVMCVGQTSSGDGLTASLYAHDIYGEGSIFTLDVDTAANPSAQLIRDGIDLDELGVDLTGEKVIDSIYPQATLDPAGADLEISIGGSDGFNDQPVFSDYQTYNGDDLYKLDYRMPGRYLSMKMRYADYKSFTLSGFDLDIQVTGSR